MTSPFNVDVGMEVFPTFFDFMILPVSFPLMLMMMIDVW
jgi:hypothetical protein